jgi:hypothetical protein
LYEQLKSFVVDPYDDTQELVLGRLVEIARKAGSRCLPDVWDSSHRVEHPAPGPEAQPQPQPVHPLDEQGGREMTRPAPKRPGGTSLTERYQKAKAALAKADPFYTSEGFWRGFESAPVDKAQVAELEKMARSYQRRDT